MDISYGVLISCIIFLVIYSLYEEYVRHEEPFLNNKPNINDTINRSLRKIEECLKYETKSAIWRRIIIPTIITIFTLFFLIHSNIPSIKTFLLYFIVIFSIFYINRIHYIQRTVYKAIQIGVDNIEQIKKNKQPKIHNLTKKIKSSLTTNSIYINKNHNKKQ